MLAHEQKKASLSNTSLPRWRLTFIKMDDGWPVDIARRYVNADTEDAAKAVGLEMLEQFNADYVEVMKVAL